MKRIIVLVFITIPYILIGQSIISGKVIDENKNPIPFCNVLLVSQLEMKILTVGLLTKMGTLKLKQIIWAQSS